MFGPGTVVEGVRGDLSHPAAIVVTGGTATLDGATVNSTLGGAGLHVTGTNSFAVVRGATQLFDNAGAGIRLDAGGTVTVDGDNVQIYDNAEGVLASGSGSHATIYGALIRNNAGPGVRATAGGRVDLLRLPAGGGGTTSFTSSSAQAIRLDNNAGGLYATGTGKQPGGVISTEQAFNCVQEPCPPGPLGQNSLTNNNAGDAYDVSALMGARVRATYNYWGTNLIGLVQVQADDPKMVQIDPILELPPSGSSAASRAGGSAQEAAGTLAGRGRVRDDVQSLLTEADAFVQRGDSVTAGERLLAAWGMCASDDDRLAVSEAAGRTLAAVQPAALVAWAEQGAAGGATRPWARRALAHLLAGQGRYAEAASVAEALSAEGGTGEAAEWHRARGFALRVEIAVATRDSTAALSALASLAEVDPEGAADAAVPVAVAFPNQDVTLALGSGGLAARGGSRSTASSSAAEARSSVALTVGPNPASGTVRVTLWPGAATSARVEVFDALGRRVAVLHDGPAGTSVVASFDAAAWPAGLYVVRAIAGSTALARSVTVAH